MPKAILEFNLPEDNDEFQDAINAGKMSSVIWDMDQWLRGNIKYNNDSRSETELKVFQECRDYLTSLTRELPDYA